jgi:hypothetical protein
MKFEELTKKDIAAAKKIYDDKSLPWDERVALLMEMFGKSERVTRRWFVALGFKKHKNPEESEAFKKAKERKFDKKKKYFLITWAQNNTPVHKQFFENIKAYAKYLDGDIHVIAGRYKNPTSIFVDKKEDYWADEVLPYLDANRHDVHPYLSIISDMKTQPTASGPLSSIEGMSHENSCIIGHPRVHMRVIPVLEGYKPKVMWTTGAVTVKDYTDSKAGKIGEFHHTLGFVIVEIKDKKVFYCRQVTATDKGDFCDLFHQVKNGKVTRVESVDTIVLGDVHVGEVDPTIMRLTEEILNRFKPGSTMVHDVFAGTSISHHEAKDPFKQYKKERNGTNVLRKEIDNMLAWIKRMEKHNLYIVRSNHDDFLDRWLINADWKQNIKNCMEYIEYAKVLLEDKAPNGIIPYIIKQYHPKVKILGRSDSYRRHSWELAQHGDVGRKGSRGSINQFKSLSTKTITAHSHAPGRIDGALSVGTMTHLRVGFNIGASDWLHAHAIVHHDGKAQHVMFIEGDYTTFKK